MADEAFSDIAAEVLREWTEDVIKDMKADLVPQVKSFSGNLAASIVPAFTKSPNAVVVEINIADYYDFVDKGVSGKQAGIKDSPYRFKNIFPNKKMADAIADWITAAGVKVPPGKGDVLKRRRSFAYAITVNRKKKGLKAKPFFAKNLDQARVDDLAKRLTEAMGRNIEIRLLSS